MNYFTFSRKQNISLKSGRDGESLRKNLTIWRSYAIIYKLSAAIAQPVERILGKDEVASSNLASSSKKEAHPKGWASFLDMTVLVNWRPHPLPEGQIQSRGRKGSHEASFVGGR